MADIIKNNAVRDGYAEVEFSEAAEEQTMYYNTVDEKTVILAVNESASGDAEITISAGNGMRSSIGDLVVTAAAGTTTVIGPLDSMRFKNLSDGKVTIGVSGGTVKLAHLTL